MFQQAEPTLERSAGGLGIGLTLARRLVEMHEGRIDIRSPGPGQGTEVEIHLPIRAAEDAEIARGQTAGGGGRGTTFASSLSKTIWMPRRCSMWRCPVWVTSPGWPMMAPRPSLREAVRAGRDFPRHRPPGDEWLCGRANPARSAGIQPRLYRRGHGWGQEEDRRKAREAGFDSHFTKPLSPDVLEDVLGAIAQRLVSGATAATTANAPRGVSSRCFEAAAAEPPGRLVNSSASTA